MKHTTKMCRRLLCAAAALMLIGSIGAWMLQTSFFSVRVEDIHLPTNHQQTLHAIAYIPKSASAENKAPVVIVCHGWSDSAEKMDASCIELSRRGIVVISMDAYGHGLSSNIAGLMPSSGIDGLGMVPLVDYCASGILDYVDTDRIGLMGYSMGGSALGGAMVHYGELYTAAYEQAQSAASDGGSTVTEAEQAYCDSLYPVNAILATANLDATVTRCFDTLHVNFGAVKGTHEETKAAVQAGEIEGRPEGNDIVHFQTALGLLKTIDPEATDVRVNTYYGDKADGTLRVFYEPVTTHPLLVLFPNATTRIIEYWTYVWDIDTPLEAGNQIYLIKELLNLAALIGLLLMIMPVGELLLSVPCFSSLCGAEGPKVPAIQGKQKNMFWIGIALNAGISYLTIIITFKLYGTPLYMKLFPNSMIAGSHTFSATGVSVIWVWMLLNTIWLAVWFWVNYFRDKKAGLRTPEMIGWTIGGAEFLKTLAFAACVFGAIYAIVGFAKWAFNTDFRFWAVAFKVFNVGKLWTWLVYFPLFFLFYLMNSLFVNGALRVENMSEKKSLLLAAASNALGVFVMIVIQYGCVAATGHVFYNSDWICAYWIGLCIWQLFIAPYYLRFFYKRTGKNWAGALIISSLYTMCAVGNTVISNTWF